MTNLFTWDVKETTLHLNDGTLIEGKKALLRDDTNKLIGINSDKYTVFSNTELTQVAQIIAEDNRITKKSTFEVAGGKRVIAQLKMKNNLKIADDTVEEYITLINAHDGTGGLSIGFSNKVLSCANQYFAFKKMAHYSVSHNQKMTENVELILKDVEEIKIRRHDLNKKFKEFAKIELLNPTDLAVKMVNHLTGVDLMLTAEKLNEEFSKNKITKAEKLLGVTKSEMDSKGNTLWGLFNGATFYSNHHMMAKNVESNLLYGSGAKMNSSAMEFVTNELMAH